MKVCLNCGNQIKYLVEIDGRVRNLQRRKYCLDCSPFNSKNTRRIHLKGVIKDKKAVVCKECGKTFVFKHKADTLDRCQTCVNKTARLKNKKRYVEYKGGKCERCDYSKSLKALCFHHTNPNEKEFQISNYSTRNWEKVRQELDKCILLCANCHMEEHA